MINQWLLLKFLIYFKMSKTRTNSQHLKIKIRWNIIFNSTKFSTMMILKMRSWHLKYPLLNNLIIKRMLHLLNSFKASLIETLRKINWDDLLKNKSSYTWFNQLQEVEWANKKTYLLQENNLLDSLTHSVK
jgi:hypothetical protein